LTTQYGTGNPQPLSNAERKRGRGQGPVSICWTPATTRPRTTPATREIQGDDDDLDIEEALTFPRKKRAPRTQDVLPDEITDFDGDARTGGQNVDEAEGEYATYQNFVASMNETDPDPNAGMDGEDFIEGTSLGPLPRHDRDGDGRGPRPGHASAAGSGPRRLPDHRTRRPACPRLLGGSDDDTLDDPNRTGDLTEAEGGALPDPNQINDETDPMNQDEALLEDDLGHDAGRIPTDNPAPVTRDEALDATRRLQ
jgi:hypothetical protein